MPFNNVDTPEGAGSYFFSQAGSWQNGGTNNVRFTVSGVVVTNMTTPITIEPGIYNVTEIVPAGWNNTASDCEKNSISLGTTLNINITAGDVVECIFDNTFIPVNGTLKIIN